MTITDEARSFFHFFATKFQQAEAYVLDMVKNPAKLKALEQEGRTAIAEAMSVCKVVTMLTGSSSVAAVAAQLSQKLAIIDAALAKAEAATAG